MEMTFWGFWILLSFVVEAVEVSFEPCTYSFPVWVWVPLKFAYLSLTMLTITQRLAKGNKKVK